MIRVKNLKKNYEINGNCTNALDNISFDILENGLYSIVGKSGSGKSTLLNMLGLLEKPTSGEIEIFGEAIDSLNDKQQEKIRVETLGFVFQDFNLISDFSVIENVKIAGISDEKTINTILNIMELQNKINTPVYLLSGGEKQRLAIARAIAKNSKILLLDEPTGNLDSENTKKVFSILKKISKDKIIIVVTHDLTSAYAYSDKVFELDSGKIIKAWVNDLDNDMEFNIKDKNIDVIANIYQCLYPVLTNQNKKFLVIYEDCRKEEVDLNSSNIIKKIEEIIASDNSEIIKLKALKIDNEASYDIIEAIDKSGSTSKLDLLFCIKYAISLIKKKMKRFLLTCLLLTLSLSLLFSYLNISGFNSSKSIMSALNNNNINYLPIQSEIYNANSDEYVKYTSGKYLTNRYDEFDLVAFFDTNVDNQYHYSMNEIILPLHVVITNDSDNKAIITDFAAKYIYNSDDIVDELLTIEDNEFGKLQFNISEIIDTDYDIDILNNYLSNQKFYYENLDSLNTYYNVVYISKSLFVEQLMGKSINVRGSNFTITNEVTSVYTASYNSLQYKCFINDDLLLGTSPNSINEIVVTKGFYDNYLSSISIEDILGVSYSYKDIYSGVNSNLCQGFINLYDISPTVKIVGISEDEKIKILTTNEFFSKLVLESSTLMVDGIAFSMNNDLEKILSSVDANNDIIYMELIAPVYEFNYLIKSFANNVLLVIGIILLLISTITIIQYTMINVQLKYKEIAILRSLGKSKKSISKIYYILNLFQAILALMCSYVIGVIAMVALNNLLKSTNFLNINYDIIFVAFISFVIPLIFSLCIAILSTYITLHLSLKNDINIVIKNN